jgi:myo-inositol-1(or 4)-monophosphatase
MTEMMPTVLEVARGAASLLREGYGHAEQVEFKGAVDLVTEWDHRSEEYIVNALRKDFPDFAVRAEERGADNRPSDYEWVIDPIDGTTNFAHGLPVFAISIALTQRGRPILGVVVDVPRDEYYTAEAGRGAAVNGRPIHVSTARSLAMSLLGTGFPYDVRTNPDNNVAHWDNFIVRTQAVRRIGSAALDLAWTAAGHFDGYWEYRLNSWDVMAGALMVAEAGGIVTDANGGGDYLEGESIVASNGLIHEEMLEVLRLGVAAPRPEEEGKKGKEGN